MLLALLAFHTVAAAGPRYRRLVALAEVGLLSELRLKYSGMYQWLKNMAALRLLALLQPIKRMDRCLVPAAARLRMEVSRDRLRTQSK